MRPIHFFILFVSLATSSLDVSSQDSKAANPGSLEDSSVRAVEEELNAIESESGLDELTRGILLERYRATLISLTQAAEFRGREAEFREALQNGSREKEELESERDALSQAESVPMPDSVDEESSETEIQTALSREQGALSQWQEEERALEAELEIILARPTALRDRLYAAQGELNAAQSELEVAQSTLGQSPSRADRAELVRLDAVTKQLGSEIAMLEQEDASQEIRVLLLEARVDLVEAKRNASESRIASLRDLASRRVGDQIREAVEAVQLVRQKATDVSSFLQDLEDELKQLSREINRSSEGTRAVEDSLRVRKEERERIAEAFRLLKRELELGGGEGAMGQLLVERIRLLPSAQAGRQEIERIRKLIAEVQSNAYELERSLMELDLETETIPSSLKEFEPELTEVQATREDLQSDLRKNYRKWIR
ncbi:MAG: hypothetical protein AAF491_09800, partial [Verrucomicrobiota bacterium]